jgi:hypothetical protein
VQLNEAVLHEIGCHIGRPRQQRGQAYELGVVAGVEVAESGQIRSVRWPRRLNRWHCSEREKRAVVAMAEGVSTERDDGGIRPSPTVSTDDATHLAHHN